MKTLPLHVLDLVPQCYSAEDGQQVYQAVTPPLARGEHVVLSFAGVAVVTSSFANTALVPLLDLVGADALRERLALRDLRPAVARLLRQRLASEATRRAQAVES